MITVNNIKKFFVLIGLQMIFWNFYSQDSISKNKNTEFQIKGAWLPVFIGYNYIGAVGLRWNNTNEINIGYKYLECMFTPSNSSIHSLILLEYKHFINSKRDEYISSYVKLRKYNYKDFDGYYGYNYDEKSIGFGFTYGEYLYLNKKKWLFLNYFVGGGWFIPINSEGYYNSNYLGGGDKKYGYSPDILIRSVDLRLGVLLGIKFKKQSLITVSLTHKSL